MLKQYGRLLKVKHGTRYGRFNLHRVIRKVPFVWLSWAIVGHIKMCRNAIAVYERMIAGEVFPDIHSEFNALIMHNKKREALLLEQFMQMLTYEPKVGSMEVQHVGNGVYQLVKITHINSKLRVGTLNIIRVGTKEECEKLRDLMK